MTDPSRDAWPAPQGSRPPLPGPPPPRPGSFPAPPGPFPAPGGEAGVPVARRAGWAGFDGARQDRRSALLTVLGLALAGLPAGLVWLWLAPRASFRVTATDVEPIGGPVSPELFMADDGMYVLVLAALGLLAGIGVWLLRRHRGVVVLAALAAGMIAASLMAWQFGQLLGPPPTHQQLADVGSTVITGVRLRAVAAVAVGPFVAVLTYLVATTLNSQDDLGRTGARRVSPPAGLPAEQPAA